MHRIAHVINAQSHPSLSIRFVLPLVIYCFLAGSSCVPGITVAFLLFMKPLYLDGIVQNSSILSALAMESLVVVSLLCTVVKQTLAFMTTAIAFIIVFVLLPSCDWWHMLECNSTPSGSMWMAADVRVLNRIQAISNHHSAPSVATDYDNSHYFVLHNLLIMLQPLNKQCLRKISRSATCWFICFGWVDNELCLFFTKCQHFFLLCISAASWSISTTWDIFYAGIPLYNFKNSVCKKVNIASH